ncbi:hypothetical protein H6F42_20770 [Pseudanabaena sp. FACHB-1998]|uniref:hypothetical protein n=1 Tax=Pseudanabaena sp. FACHB-1998 TaxID=2692858 RepID=UPI001680A1F9|nr:hypothetical protein [Pseudanabaena sp. FACHB-1998]MBD2179361.1 hypothetical protein [Pseudanabaena sp. FACHB-1998]
MPENRPCSTVVEVATEQLTELSDRWFASIKNKDKLTRKVDIISFLEDAVRALLASGSTYNEISQNLKDELHVDISAKTIKQYIWRINEKQKKAGTKAKTHTARAKKALQQNKSLESDLTQQPIASLSDSIENIPSAMETLADVDSSDRTQPISLVKPNSIKTSNPKSIVPKSVPVDDDDDDDYLAQQKILKHYNRY